MKILEMCGCTKLVYYFGLSLEVPDWTKYIAVDSYNNLWVLGDDNRPWKTEGGFWDTDSKQECIALVDLEGLDWKDSLMTY